MKYKPPLRPMPQVSVNRPSVQGSRGSQWATKSGSERYHLPPEEAELREREWYLQNEARKLGLSVKSSIKSGPVSSRGTYVRESISPLQIEKANECAADIARAVSSAFEMPLNSSRFGEQFAKASNSFSQLSELYKSNKEHVKRRGQQDMDERLYQFGTRLHNAGYWGPRLIGKAERAAREQPSIWSRILSSFSSTQPGTDVVSECPSVEPTHESVPGAYSHTDTMDVCVPQDLMEAINRAGAPYTCASTNGWDSEWGSEITLGNTNAACAPTLGAGR